MTPSALSISPSLAGQTLAAVLRGHLGNISWSAARRLISARRVLVNGSVCLDDARRLKSGETLAVISGANAVAPPQDAVQIVHRDEHLLVVDKPAGLQTLRRPEEKDWSVERKMRQPVLAEVLEQKLGRASRLRAVHRLDRDTSGLMLFALSPLAEQKLVRAFARHAIGRTYLAVVHGDVPEATRFDSHLARDRGDGLRGSVSPPPPAGAQRAITHIRPIERLGRQFTLVECRLETGRTHQIRIHLSEAGHMLCGEKIYRSARAGEPPRGDASGAPRQALHSWQLNFTHPISGQEIGLESPWPTDLEKWMASLRGGRSADRPT